MASDLYHNLDSQKHEIRIRILTVLSHKASVPLPSLSRPGPQSHVSSIEAVDIHCTLRIVSLDDKPLYTALSYVWGTDTPSIPVLVNGILILVRSNLATALRHLQRKDDPICIWADAICINQEDAREKSSQVQMMARIFGGAVEVVAWLGPAGEDSDAAMEKLEDLGRKAIESGMPDFRASIDMPCWFDNDVDERLQKLRASLDGLAEREGYDIFHPALTPLSERAYWNRMWVLQEFSIPRIVNIQCGYKKLNVKTFGMAFNFYTFAGWKLLSGLTLDEYNSKISKTRLTNGNDRPLSGYPNKLYGARRIYHSETGERETLVELLQRAHILGADKLPLNATDPRDKVYGLLALAADSEQLGILPDYKKSVADVYTDTSRALLAMGETKILSWCQQANRMEGLPSWAPDFSSYIAPAYAANWKTDSLFRTSGDTRFPGLILPSSQDNSHCIGLSGLKVSVITSLGSICTPDHDSVPTSQQGHSLSWADSKQLISQVEAFCRQSNFFKTPEQVADASMRIPCADQQAFGSAKRRASISLKAQFDMIKVMDNTTFDKNAAEYRRYMLLQRDRRSFLSDSGHVGLVPARAQPGDWICIFFGSPVPFVVREDKHGKFLLVGEAYVHEIMDGEWVDERRGEEVFTFFIY